MSWKDSGIYILIKTISIIFLIFFVGIVFEKIVDHKPKAYGVVV